ncbi:PhnD/SsuA/transferrin family substrate-binding protein [Rhodoferax sp.]|uniref:phosphate/phosphite/phosphonate ABC transporter substrate-binding protein n=1 Tax=Rhodoferax sp. TaxID=50421 RepID=UPI0025E28358|nr:PhnD/SsuA/transferrin family substrate-binding protein [Rhodoferax sp.]
MIAALPMYLSHPAGNTALWHSIAQYLRQAGVADVPAELSIPTNADLTAHWLRPDLLLSQCCGYQMVDALEAKVQLVGAFRYTVPGCDGIHYSSHLVCRADDPSSSLAAFRNRVAAYNSSDSQSGYRSLRDMVAPLAVGGQLFARTIASGAHVDSLALVCSGQADIAAIDCISYAQFQRFQPEAVDGIRILGRTASAPGTPLITALGTPPALLALLRQSLHRTMADPALATTRAQLLIGGFKVVDAAAYAGMKEMDRQAAALGLARL